MDVAIIGAGASGLCLAIKILEKDPKRSVVLLEKYPRAAKKLISTGNGKCNYTNTNLDIKSYHTDCEDRAEGIIKRFGSREIIDFFGGLGILPSVVMEKLVYPRSMQASSVADILRLKAENLGAEIICDFDVKSAEYRGEYIIKSVSGQCVRAEKLVIASGSGAFIGSDKGFEILKGFGHTIKKTYAALVPIKCKTKSSACAKGMRCTADVSLLKNGKKVAENSGEVLFTDYGVSGIVIMQLSGIVSKSLALGEGANFSLSLDMMSEKNETELFELLKERREKMRYLKCEDFFCGMANKRIGIAVLKECGINTGGAVASLTDASLLKIARCIKGYRLNVTGMCEKNNAQVTGGGADLAEFDEFLQSKKQQGLYACGEVLDVWGDCGGFNLSWAWASAHAVSESI